MRHLNTLGGQPGVIVGILGIAFSLTQGCANGDTKQGDGSVGGTANAVTGGSASTQVGNTSQGGTTSNVTGNTGGLAAAGGSMQGGAGGDQGGANTGGVLAGGTSSNQDTGGANAGGDSTAGGANMGGTTQATGGAAPTGGAATGGMPAVACQNSLSCSSAPNNQIVCDTNAGHCVQCVSAADCTENPTFGQYYDCTANQCISYTPCGGDAGDTCATGVCDTAKQRCVGCTTDNDCGTGKTCLAQTCRTSCASDIPCTALGQLCNKTLGVCVQCGAPNQAACAGGLVCDANGDCAPPVCASGDERCDTGGIAICLSDGSGYAAPIACPIGSSCQAQSGSAACYDADGGVVYNCAKQAGDPCQQIPKFTGTQILDGNGDEMCVVPAAKLDATHNQGVIAWHSTPPEVATIRVAWSSAGLNVFVDVTDASVQTVSMTNADGATQISRVYQGDSIELMISSNNNVTGNTGDDASTLHVQVPAQGLAAMVKSKNSNGTATELPKAQYAQKLTATGYAIEMLLPWPGAAPAANATVRFDMTLNSADTNFGSIDDMRDGVLLYHVQTVAQTTCPSMSSPDLPIEPWCDDRSWCATPLK